MCLSKTRKHNIVLSPYIAEVFQVFVSEFTPTSPKMLGLFVARGSWLNDLKRMGRKQKPVKNAIVTSSLNFS